MNNNLTELVFILDRSGSMAGLEGDTIGGFNSMLEKQKRENGDAFITTVLFDDRCERIHDRVEIKNINPLSGSEYYVRGTTALLDALGSTVKHIARIHKYARKEDVPAKTVFVIITDGMENSSRRYRPREVSAMVKHEQEKYGWEFIFLGANMDVIAAARDIGIREDRAVRYTCDSQGTQLNYEALSDAVCALRREKAMPANWRSRIDEDCKARG